MKRFVDGMDEVYVLEVTDVESAGVISEKVYLYSEKLERDKDELENLCEGTEWKVSVVVDNVGMFCEELDEKVIPNLLLSKKLYNSNRGGF